MYTSTDGLQKVWALELHYINGSLYVYTAVVRAAVIDDVGPADENAAGLRDEPWPLDVRVERHE